MWKYKGIQIEDPSPICVKVKPCKWFEVSLAVYTGNQRIEKPTFFCPWGQFQLTQKVERLPQRRCSCKNKNKM